MFDEKKIEKTCFISPKAYVSGRVRIGEHSSVWPFASVRGDLNGIVIGTRSNVQESATLHVTVEQGVQIGDLCTIGHGAVVHGATVGDRCLIGINATVLDGAVIGEDSIVAANALVPDGTLIPPRSLVMGVPAKVVRTLDEDARQRIVDNATTYVTLAKSYKNVEG
jgi:carbonic anhydrase/acetyltransferase-like protein (isoleucine patch superfamily)